MPGTEAPPPVHEHIRFEETDIAAPRVFLTGVAILLGTWFFIAALYGFYAFLVRERAAAQPSLPARAVGRIFVPPEPRLERAPAADLMAFRAREDSALNGYGWADKQKGTVTLPIERAMELIAQRGIPPQKDWSSLKLPIPLAGSRDTGFEGKVEPEPR